MLVREGFRNGLADVRIVYWAGGRFCGTVYGVLPPESGAGDEECGGHAWCIGCLARDRNGRRPLMYSTRKRIPKNDGHAGWRPHQWQKMLSTSSVAEAC